jgi:protein-disulfide isomerase/uncharacterized membrane protein
MNKKNTFSTIVLLLCCAGIFFSYILAQDYHFSALYKKSGTRLSIFTNFSANACGEKNTLLDCDAVKNSKYSRFLDIPLHAWGMIYFILASLAAVVPFFITQARHRDFYIAYFWIIALGSLLDIALFFIQWLVIRSFCPFCLVTYAVNWVLLAVLALYLRAAGANPLSAPAMILSFIRASSNRIIGRVMIAVLVIIFASATLGLGIDLYLQSNVRKYKRIQEEKAISEIVKEFSTQMQYNVSFSGNAIIGNDYAPVTITVFSDFACSHCKSAAHTLSAVVRKMPNTVKVLFINFPLEKTCNRIVKSQMHQGACLLAKGAICASRQNEFERFHDAAFNMSYGRVTIQEVREAAMHGALNMPEFDACMAFGDAEIELKQQIESAIRLGIHSTPTIFINKRHYRRKIAEQILIILVNGELMGWR